MSEYGERGRQRAREIQELLSERDFAIVVMFGSGYTYEQIGELLDITKERARQQRLRAKKLLTSDDPR